jgi:hypothetical protein
MAFNAPEKLPGSNEYFDALMDADLAEQDAKRAERMGQIAKAAMLRKQRDKHRARAAELAPRD